jgi:hypothetical protein
MKINARQRVEATRLLASNAWQGDHDFTGESLVAWMKMKDRYLKFLIAASAGKGAAFPTAVRCPLSVSYDRLLPGYPVQLGTDAGNRWASAVRRIRYMR